jgi:DNA-binding SARP family transcriptional activator
MPVVPQLPGRPQTGEAVEPLSWTGPPPHVLYRLDLLGGFELTTACGRVAVPVNARRVLACLALTGGARRAVLAGRLWPAASEPRAMGSLRSTVWRIQHQCPGILSCEAGGLALGSGVSVDVAELVDVARAILRENGSQRCGEIPAVLLRPDLLPGSYEDWVLVEQERLRQLRLHALERLSTLLTRGGAYGAALETAWLCLQAEPLRESAHRAVVSVHLAEGNLMEARRHYDHAADLLVREIGMPPSPMFLELERRLPPARPRAVPLPRRPRDLKVPPPPP